MNTRDRQKEHGQSIVIIAVALIVLLIFGAFAVDLSFAYFQRRSMQNAADAAALAGARALGAYQSDPTAPSMTNGDLYLIIQEYAARNQAKYVEAYYTNPGGNRAGPIQPGGGGTVPKSGQTGVEVIASTDFSTFFARVMGYSLLDAEASAGAAYGSATSAKYVSPLAVHKDDAETGDVCVLWDKNTATGNADTGWLALTCRYPSSGSYCTPTNPDLLDWTTNGYAGIVRAPGQYSGDPSHAYWGNVSHLQPGDVVVVPVFDEVRHYTTYAKCDPDYVAVHGAYECWNNEIYGEVIPIYTHDPAYEVFYYYDIESFAACEVHEVGSESVTGEYIPFSVEGDWINPENDGVFVVKLTDNKGAPTQVPTATPPPPPSDAELALSFSPQDNPGIGPYVFTLTVENIGQHGSAHDVAIELTAIAGSEWFYAISPEVWDVGEVSPGEVRTVEVILTPTESWKFPTDLGGADIGTVITIEARVIAESSRPEVNVNRTATGNAIKDEDFVPEPTPTTDESTPRALETPDGTPTPTPNPFGDHIIEYIGGGYDGDNDETTFKYRVTSGGSPAISNWILALESCIAYDDILWASEPYEYANPDPHSGYTGTKFETGYDDGEVREVWIRLRGQIDLVLLSYNVGVKSGTDTYKGGVLGPGCLEEGGDAPESTPTPESTATPEATPTEDGDAPTPTPTVTPNMLGPHQINFLGSTYDGTNTTFTYQVISGDAPAISHWVLDGCFFGDDVVSASEAYTYVMSDPAIQVSGVKFDQGYADGEERIVQITLAGQYSEEGRLYEIGVKSGGDTHFGTVVGPGCYEEPFNIRINVGGGDWTDPYGNEWVADHQYSGGTARNPGTTDDIIGTQMDYILQRYRLGAFYYLWTDVPNGDYVVKLWFVEPWWTQDNKREFKVFINGAKVMNKYDIHSEVGYLRKALKTFTTTVTDNRLKINFMTQTDDPIVSGIVILSR